MVRTLNEMQIIGAYMNDKELFRFRSTKYLFGDFNELENQEVYFSSPEDLNDSMENFKDFIWKGDQILWVNFLKHYILSLEMATVYALLSTSEDKLNGDLINPFYSYCDLPTDLYKSKIDMIYDAFFSKKEVIDFIDYASNKKDSIDVEELKTHVSILHRNALELVLSNNKIDILSNKKPLSSESQGKSIYDVIKSYENIDTNKLKVIFSITNRAYYEMHLMTAYAFKNHPNERFRYLLADFPNDYIRNIEKLTYPNWYTACFMGNANSPLAWGYYADGHRGVCLIFDTDVDKTYNEDYLYVNIINSISSNGIKKQMTKMKFNPVQYVEQLPKIDFFINLGNIQNHKLKSQWYSDSEGNLSSRANEVYQNMDEWRIKYWSIFENIHNTKTVHWKYENEYRLVLTSLLGTYESKEERSIKYDFKCLKGIIFGIKTSLDDKLKIIESIEKKCRNENRSSFDFYQANYDLTNQSINYEKINLIDFNKAHRLTHSPRN